MTRPLIPWLFTIVLCVLCSCAKISAPQGGPEDMTPPTLLRSVPDSAQIKYQGRTILLEFDEWVKANNIQTNLIITPNIPGGFKTKVNKRVIELIFPEPFEDSTTYTFNFGNTISDITNNNSPKDLRLSFSTGSYIDSLQISGNIVDLYTQDPKQNTLVSLYTITDSLDITTGSAPYSTRTDSLGNYKFTNLPSKKYFLYAVFDQNNNLKAETDSEAYGFYPDTLNLTSNASQIDFSIQRLNTKPIRVSSARPFGKYFDISFSKPITSFELSQLDKSEPIIHSHLSPDKIRLFNLNNQFGDTTLLKVRAYDSLQVELIDTVSAYFIDSRIQPEKLTLEILPAKTSFQSEVPFQINFNKPIATFNPDSLSYQIDSLSSMQLADSIFSWDENRTSVSWKMELSQYSQPGQFLSLDIQPAAFISIERDTSSLETKDIQYALFEDTGLISGKITTNAENFLIQLLSVPDLKVISQLRNQAEYTFPGIDPGVYFIRVIEDTNNNGVWETGNIFTRTPPERTHFFYDSFNKTKQIRLRKNWELTDIDVSFIVDN